MAAPYTRRFPGGFVDKPTVTTPIEAAFLNAVEDALIALLGEAPSADEVGVWVGGAGGGLVYQKITNAQIAAGAAIDKSKLAALNITDADIAAAAGIAKSKLGPLNIADADIQAAAAIAISKLAGYPSDTMKGLRGDGTWGYGGEELILDHVPSGAGGNTLDSNTILGGVLPTGFKHLKFVVNFATDNASAATLFMRFNNDASAVYNDTYIAMNASAAPSGVERVNQTSGYIGGEFAAPAGWPSGSACTVEVLIPDYNDPFRNQNWHFRGVRDNTGGGAGAIIVRIGAGSWRAQGAITRLQIFSNLSGNWTSNSRWSLYGLK